MNKQRGLLVMAHGSRKDQANQEFLQLVAQLASHMKGYHCIEPCFLELTQPTLEAAIAKALLLNIQAFDLYPLFFNQGNHVMRDIPQQITQAKIQFPDIELQQLDYFGSNPLLSQFIQQHIHLQR